MVFSWFPAASLVFKAVCPADYIPRSSPYFLVYPPHIFAHNPDTEDGNAYEEEEYGEEGEYPFHLGSDHEAPNQEKNGEGDGEKGGTDAEQGEELQRHHREAGHQVEIEPDQPVEGILALSLGTFSVGHFHFTRVDGEGLRQGRDKGGGLPAAVDVVDDVSVICAKHAAVVAHAHPGHLVGGFVDHPRCRFAEQGILPLLADGPYHVVPIFHLSDQLGDFLRRILEVGVEGDNYFPFAALKGGEDGHVLAEVPVELDNPHLGILVREPFQQGKGAVPGAVVGEDDLEGTAGALHDRVEAGEQRAEVTLLVVDRDDYGDVRFIRHELNPACRGTPLWVPCFGQA